MKVNFYGLDRQYNTLKDELLDATDQALKSGQLVDGPFTTRFEEWLMMRTGYPFAVTVHSGTQALEIIARGEIEAFKPTFNLPPKVVVPELTYIATLNAFLNAGYEVEIGEVDKNGILDSKKYEEYHSGFAYYHCPVGLYGAPSVTEYALAPNTDIVDGAQHWLIHHSDDAVSMAISFDPTKNLPASGNGGAILTRDREIWEYAIAYRNNGKKYYIQEDIAIAGTNSKMSEQECAQIYARSKHIDAWQKRRRDIRIYYLKQFESMPFRCMSRSFPIHADQKFVIYTQKRDELKYFLETQGIQTKVHYELPLGQHPIAKNLKKPDIFSVGAMLSKGVLSLPIYPEMTDLEVEYVAEKVKSFFTSTL